MLIPLPTNTLDALAAEFNLSEFGRTVIEKMVRLDDRQWDVIFELVASIVADMSTTKTDPTVTEQSQLSELAGKPVPEPDDDAAIEAAARKKAEAYYEQLLLEARMRTSEESTPAKTG